MVNIKQLAEMIIKIASKKLSIQLVKGPLGVRGRCSDNQLIKEKLHWEPTTKLYDGLLKTYKWIEKQVKITRKIFSYIIYFQYTQ